MRSQSLFSFYHWNASRHCRDPQTFCRVRQWCPCQPYISHSRGWLSSAKIHHPRHCKYWRAEGLLVYRLILADRQKLSETSRGLPSNQSAFLRWRSHVESETCWKCKSPSLIFGCHPLDLWVLNVALETCKDLSFSYLDLGNKLLIVGIEDLHGIDLWKCYGK